MDKVLITGANGFVGRALVNAMLKLSMKPVAAARNNSESIGEKNRVC